MNMKKRYSKAEMIKMRNSCFEIKRRLCRAENISEFMQYLATKDNPQIKAAFCYYMGGMLSFLSDDINYIHDEINNIDFFSDHEWNKKIFGLRD
ncbi:hypothetical protein [Salmonella enterica]|nr:hypothetical protein [Salmonella enterica]ECM0177503.1 hypothetical protein [Salmonella enterica subsp. enterica serovar Give]ECM0354812.1 hypothetical protein [Salmonella enterica subsp. enterica serovar Rubislaw]EDB4089109.1 hypothetical protein [Salmonella enterica subsp. enterica serovar Typhimurium]EDE3115170.1 hypothetical protein [Salmonella enterica subsp. enterica serovar Muenchen]EDE3962544.1 hypothetical protein [Salmonella enterica subsp. enterica serovar Poona]EDV0466973.1 hyp